jgi:hypothetical protein
MSTAQSVQTEALGAGAAVGDQIHLQEARLGVVPVGEGADGDLVAQQVAGAGDAGAPRGKLRPRRRQQAAEGGPTELPQELVDLGSNRQFPPEHQPVQQLGDERLQAMGADPAARLPQHLRGAGHLAPVGPRPAAGPWARPGPRRPPEQANGGLAVQAGHGDDLVQEPLLVGPRRLKVALALYCRVLPKAGSCHGLLPHGVGNRDF